MLIMVSNRIKTVIGHHVTRYLLLATLVAALSGCFEIGKYALQHTLGARLGPCQPKKDSVQAALGKPYRRLVADDEDVSAETQIFWHEWAYRIPRDSAGAAITSDPPAAIPDSVKVIGFRWGDGVWGCQVRERRVRMLDHPSDPWEGAGDVPRS